MCIRDRAVGLHHFICTLPKGYDTILNDQVSLSQGQKPVSYTHLTPGASPWTPGFYGRSFPLAGFCVGYVWTGRRAVTSGIPTPIWNAFSGKNMLKSIFAKEGSQVRG